MHLYVLARGQADRLKRWVNDCLARYYTLKYGEDKDGKPLMGKVQLSMRPIQLYEIVFPEEHLEAVCSALQPYGGYGFNEGVKGKLKKMIVKLLKLDPIPQVPPDIKDLQNNPLYRDFVDCMGIGIKKDKYCAEKRREDL